MSFKPELLDELLANYSKPDDLIGKDGIFQKLKKALLERALGAELSCHLGYEKGDPRGRCTSNSRNGYSSKTITTDQRGGRVSLDNCNEIYKW
jgi:putative transposase